MSILTKYSLWLTGILLLAAGSIITAALWMQSQALTEQAILRGHSLAVNLASAGSDALLRKNDLVLIGLAISTTHDHADVVYAAILNKDGKVMGHADPKALHQSLDLIAGHEFKAKDDGHVVTEGLSMGQKVWDIAVPVVLRGTRQSLGSVHVGMARSTVTAAIRRSLGRLALVGILILFVGLVLTYVAVRAVVKPLREVAAASAVVGSGNLTVILPVHSNDELGTLSSNFNAMVVGLRTAEEAKSRQQRIESELQLARDIQAGLLPPSPPNIPGLETAFSCTPAKELGGDFYDCFEILGGKAWGFLIADVSGKGVPAALHMANLHNVFRILAVESLSPAETLKRVNKIAFGDLKGESFITMIFAVVDLPSRKVRLVNAGHDPAYWINGQGVITAYESTAMPVGLTDGPDYDDEVTEVSFELAPGDLLFTFTDGVTEAMDASSRQFGLESLQASVTLPGSASERVERLVAQVKAHAGDFEQSDDITMLAIRAL